MLRLWKVDSPIGGFHSFNEAHDSLIAKRFAEGGSLLFPSSDGNYLFLETPPLFPYLLTGVFRVFGVSIVAGRLVSVAASLCLVCATFWLGRRLFSQPAGLAAAVLVAVAPVSVLTGRNIQADALCLALLVGAYFFWGKAEGGSAGSRLAAGILAGLALFAKLFAAVGLAALLTWELISHGLSFLRDRVRWLATGLALLLPALFYGWHASRDFEHVRREVLGGAAAATAFPADMDAWSSLGLEALWAFSPLIAALLIVGALAALAKPSRESLFAFLPLALFAASYLVVHKHSSYLLALLPWGALLAGRAIGALPRALRVGVLLLTAVSGAFTSAVDLCSMKLGFSEFAAFGRVADELPGAQHLVRVDGEMRDSYSPVIAFYDPKSRVVTGGAAGAAEGQESWLLAFVPPQARIPAGGWLFERERYGLELFGFTFVEAHENPHFFRQGSYVVLRTGQTADFGLKLLRRYPALALAPLGAASK